jgi:ADP-ribosyl-[dinitrogen reductase] hydrolase
MRFAGALWGLAWGDVLGCPVESWSAEEIQATFGRYVGLPRPDAVLPPSRRKRRRPIGLHTDDTQQAVGLLAMCLQGFSAKAWGQLLVEGKRRRAWRGTGRFFEAAVDKLELGIEPSASGSPSAGIGAAMRVAPVGALLARDEVQLAQVVLESSATTHAEENAVSCAVAVAFAAACLALGQSLEQVRAELPEKVASVMSAWRGAGWKLHRADGPTVTELLPQVLMPGDVNTLATRVLEVGGAYLLAGETAHPNNASARLGGLFALAVGLSDVSEPRAVLAEVVQLGADSDTVAAIVGGLFGARLGDSWVPKSQLRGARMLEGWASGVAPESIESWLDREAKWTSEERALQR